MTAATVVGSWRADAARAWPRAVPPTVLLSFAVLLVVLLWSLLPGVFASQDPVNGVPADKLLGPSADHWF
ncbi:ABC transporter permease, partial [Streptomyces griseoincarnatus]